MSRKVSLLAPCLGGSGEGPAISQLYFELEQIRDHFVQPIWGPQEQKWSQTGSNAKHKKFVIFSRQFFEFPGHSGARVTKGPVETLSGRYLTPLG